MAKRESPMQRNQREKFGMIRRGQEIAVYQKPLTFEDFEGNAKVTGIVNGPITTFFDGKRFWEYSLMVKFRGEDYSVFRRVFVKRVDQTTTA